MAQPSKRIGRYEIIEPLGRGAMGTRFLARDPVLDRLVTLQVLPLDDDDEVRARWTREARVVSQLNHKNIESILEVGEDNGRPFIAAEYIQGDTLSEIIHQRKPLSLAEKIRIVEDVCAGLDYAHKQGVVHRGINPSNIMVSSEGEAKILGFVHVPMSTGMTRAGMVVGPLNYMSPEQIAGAGSDARSDVFALGAVFYEFVTSQKAFPGDSPSGVLLRVLSEEPAPLASVVSNVPAELGLIIAKSLRKDPSQRYEDARAMKRDLLRVRDGLNGPDVPTMMLPTSAAPMEPPPPLPASSRSRAAEIERCLSKAHECLAQGRLDEAKRCTEKALALDPLNDEARAAREHVRAALEDRAREAAESQRKTVRIDENVQFSVFRPPAITPAQWYRMLVFAHLASRRPDAPLDEPDPIEEVNRRAKTLLGPVPKPITRVDSQVGIPEEGRLRVVPVVQGIEFDPPQHMFLWLQPVHQVEFSLRASPEMEGRTARGMLTIFLGAVIVAEIALAVPVEPSVDRRERRISDVVHPYRRLFASYSHKDEAIVRQFENYARGLGDRYVRDVIDLRAGEEWNPRVCELIDSADVFQLFWSTNSMESTFVRHEWEHALTVDKPQFIRPVYWQLPFPTRGGLPPVTLARLHFAFVGSPAAAGDVTVCAPVDEILERERALAVERVRASQKERAEAAQRAAVERMDSERRASEEDARRLEQQIARKRAEQAEAQGREMQRQEQQRSQRKPDERERRGGEDARAREAQARRAAMERAHAERQARQRKSERERLRQNQERRPESAGSSAPRSLPLTSRSITLVLVAILASLAVAVLVRAC